MRKVSLCTFKHITGNHRPRTLIILATYHLTFDDFTVYFCVLTLCLLARTTLLETSQTFIILATFHLTFDGMRVISRLTNSRCQQSPAEARRSTFRPHSQRGAERMQSLGVVGALSVIWCSHGWACNRHHVCKGRKLQSRRILFLTSHMCFYCDVPIPGDSQVLRKVFLQR